MTYLWGVETYDSKEECIEAIMSFLYQELAEAYCCDLSYVTEDDDRELAVRIGLNLEEIEQ